MPGMPQLPDVLLPGLKGGPEYHTTICTTDDGHEQRNVDWESGRSRWVLGCRAKLTAAYSALRTFFLERRGQQEVFAFHDPVEDRDAVVRFATDQMEVEAQGSGIARWSDLPIVEVRGEGIPYTEPDAADANLPPQMPIPELSEVVGLGSIPAGTYYVRVNVVDTFTTAPNPLYGPLSQVAGPITVGDDARIECSIPALLDDAYAVPLLFGIYLSTSPAGPWYEQHQWSSVDLASPISLSALTYNTSGPEPPLVGGLPETTDFPLPLTKVTGGPGWRTVIHAGASGHEARFSHWETQRRRFTLAHDLLTQAQAATLLAFFRVHRGRAFPFIAVDPVTGEDVLVRFETDFLEMEHAPRGLVRAFSVPIIEVYE